jgi:glycosyltransferase involved in cell wall biosynthesis
LDFVSIITLAQTPPPYHGQAVMNELFLNGEYRKIRLHHVRMAFSDDIQEVGAFRWKKIFHLIQVFFLILLSRFRTGSQILYYPPSGPNMVPFLRDCALLIGTRWLFKKTVFHFHANGLTDLYARLPWLLQKAFWLAYGNPDLSVVISGYGRKDGEFLKSKNITLIPNGIPEPPNADSLNCSARNDEPEILFCGMVSDEKGVGILLEACAKLKQEGLSFRCKIVGKAASEVEDKKFKVFIQNHQLDGTVVFTGPLYEDKKWKAYAGADIFCFPTFYSAESFGLVAVEAMIFGLPVVATSWRGLPDIVLDGETGYLVPPKDAAAIAERLASLIKNSDLRATLGAAGRRRYKHHFTVDKFRERVELALASVGSCKSGLERSK